MEVPGSHDSRVSLSLNFTIGAHRNGEQCYQCPIMVAHTDMLRVKASTSLWHLRSRFANNRIDINILALSAWLFHVLCWCRCRCRCRYYQNFINFFQHIRIISSSDHLPLDSVVADADGGRGGVSLKLFVINYLKQFEFLRNSKFTCHKWE